ncbi:MAG: deoxyribodipyrimidine photo-lyase, partial [Gammaproteobacteria bacterium]|nr:deoxyribodipyrimidine photo-lyase [Gammaproteobacteria bacterium]
MTTALVWFRRDFRLHDNAALTAALAAADTVIPVYLHAPEEEEAQGERWEATGAAAWWLHHSLRALKKDLRDSGSNLVIRRCTESLLELQKLIDATGAEVVHWNRLYEPHTVARDAQIKQALGEAGIEAVSHAGCLLHEPTMQKTKTGNPFKVFTPFWKSTRPSLDIGTPGGKPRELRAPSSWPQTMRVRELELLPDINWHDSIAAAWQPGEEGASALLHRFIDEGVAHYARGRDFPAENFTSRLSPHLHFGEITPRQVWVAIENATREKPSLEKPADKFLAEIGWREFAYHVLFHHPHTVNQPLMEKYAAFPWRDVDKDQDAAADLEAWQRGLTGYPIVDAGMRQLWRDGWMHNRVRMIVASFLVKNLRLHWWHGARWFMDTLVDADLASNTLGWQWAAGCGADAAPYFRIFNPMLQSKKFEAEDYIREYVPELREVQDAHLHAPWEAPAEALDKAGVKLGKDYPEPIIEYKASRERALAALQELKD